jgi:threonine synthase
MAAVVTTEASPTTDYRAWFQCIAGCSGHYSLQDIIYRCPRCGNLLEVQHDLDRLRQHEPAYWKTLFEKRYLRTQWPYGSSVWGKREMVCPEVEDRNVVSTFEGGTNLFWAERLGERDWGARLMDQTMWQ